MIRILFSLLLTTVFFITGAYSQNIGQIGNSIENYVDINGMKQGIWEVKYPNGKTKYKGFFKNDKPIGKFIRYYNTGNKQSEAFFYDKYSSIQFFDNAGGVVATGRYANQQKDSIWNYYLSDGKLISVEEYFNGVLNGVSKTFFYPLGLLHEIINHKNGIKDGVYEKYWSDGLTLRLRTKYCAGKICDTMFVYYPSGRIESTIPYYNDQRHGLEMNYNERGDMVEAIPYKNGVCLDPKKEIRESEELKKLIDNKGRYLEPYQFEEPTDFLRKIQNNDYTR